MIDILICRLIYPNDPTNNMQPHQHFVGFYEGTSLVLYSISSIFNKESRVYAMDGSENPECFVLSGAYQRECSLRVPSFIDCSKAYYVALEEGVDIERLSHREIPQEVREKILDKIAFLKGAGMHTQYSISGSDFLSYNERLR